MVEFLDFKIKTILGRLILCKKNKYDMLVRGISTHLNMFGTKDLSLSSLEVTVVLGGIQQLSGPNLTQF